MMGYFATITQTRHGWSASYSYRSECEPTAMLPDISWVSWDIIGPNHWRPTRRGIERVAARIIRRLEADGQRHADSYEYTGADARRIPDAD